MKHLILISFLFLFNNISFVQNTIKDIDGNIYSIEKIGKQVWMTENLRVSHFNDGTVIPYIANKNNWNETDTYAWCYFENNPKYNSTFGKLYNGYVVDSTNQLNVCPVGWKIPSLVEWQELVDFLGGDSIAGFKMKEKSLIVNIVKTEQSGGYFSYKWIPCNNCKDWNKEYKNKVPCHYCKDNRGKKVKDKFIPKITTTKNLSVQKGWNGYKLSVFRALPSGNRFSDFSIDFEEKNASCYFWSTTSKFNDYFEIPFVLTELNKYQTMHVPIKDGYSIRCIKSE
ncbi:MAG: FISUMP domain-containing protein [Crocinitomicaceae bacterium]|jgi:uncharacterized protein (TIGR02145 family)